MREQQLSHHHRAIRLDLVPVEVQVLKVGTVLERFSKALGAFAFYLIAHKVKACEAR